MECWTCNRNDHLPRPKHSGVREKSSIAMSPFGEKPRIASNLTTNLHRVHNKRIIYIFICARNVFRSCQILQAIPPSPATASRDMKSIVTKKMCQTDGKLYSTVLKAQLKSKSRRSLRRSRSFKVTDFGTNRKTIYSLY